ARRTGFQYLSGDVSTGTVVFTSGRFLLATGEKVTARIKQLAPGTVQVTMSSDPKFGVVGWSGRRGARADQLSATLNGLLPSAGSRPRSGPDSRDTASRPASPTAGLLRLRGSRRGSSWCVEPAGVCVGHGGVSRCGVDALVSPGADVARLPSSSLSATP